MEQIRIIHEPSADKPFLVIYKPKGLPSAPLSEEDTNNALWQCIQKFPSLKNVKGKKDIEYGLLHRIDTPTDGLLLIAETQDFYDFMAEEQKNGRFYKYYSAICEKSFENAVILGGFPKEKVPYSNNMTITSYFRSYGDGGREVRPVTDSSGKAAKKKLGKLKEYKTKVSVITEKNDFVQVECKITEGYRHQVRCHLAWAGLPILGDLLYNSNKKNCPQKDSSALQFSATKIEFEYPKGDLNSYEITFTWT